MKENPKMYPPDGGLKEQVRSIEDTFSAETVIMDHFFGKKNPPLSVVHDDGLQKGFKQGFLRGCMFTTAAIVGLLCLHWAFLT